MQTFLPFSNFAMCAASLDRLRLGKQRVEVLQILMALNGDSTAYVNHPITKAWRHHEWWLVQYGIKICNEWIGRGYIDNTEIKIARYAPSHKSSVPLWLGNEALHSMYRAVLVGKYPEHYRDKLGWVESPIDKTDFSLFKV